ncbi:MAG: HEPN domain-containing protein [Patescibacteria group bacterium]
MFNLYSVCYNIVVSDFEKTIAYYEESSEKDLIVAKKLFNDREFGYCLFFCHLAIEKLLKAVVVIHTNAPAEYTHSLLRLAELAELSLNINQIENLKTITKFNIAGRYEDEKWEFRKTATEEYAKKYLFITDEIISWLKKNYLKK